MLIIFFEKSKTKPGSHKSNSPVNLKRQRDYVKVRNFCIEMQIV